jgi:RNA polymerase sigma-70 factor (ECF subfamily)
VGARPRITEYNGSGPLGGWVRVAAIRVALNARREASRQERPSDPTGAAGDPELDAIHGQYRNEVEASLRAALQRLSAEDRELLRLHYIQGDSLEKIGRRYQVDRSTASRRVAAARRFLLSETKRELERRTAITPSSRDSLLVALRSKINISLETLLKG